MGLRTPVCETEYKGILIFLHSHTPARQAVSSSVREAIPKSPKSVNQYSFHLAFKRHPQNTLYTSTHYRIIILPEKYEKYIDNIGAIKNKYGYQFRIL